MVRSEKPASKDAVKDNECRLSVTPTPPVVLTELAIVCAWVHSDICCAILPMDKMS